MNEAKLVYTTEEKMMHNNIQFYDQSIALEKPLEWSIQLNQQPKYLMT
jgi:hypothetical protein